MERAFAGPAKILERFGTLDPAKIAAAPSDEFADLCATPPAIHRYGRSMAGRVQALASHVVEHYDGDAELLWADVATPGRAARPPDCAAWFRAAEGPHLRRVARQAAGGAARGLACGDRAVCRGRLVPFGRRRRRPAVAGPGPGLQEEPEGRREDVERAMTEEPKVCASCGRSPAPNEPAELTWTRGAEGVRDGVDLPGVQPAAPARDRGQTRLAVVVSA